MAQLQSTGITGSLILTGSQSLSGSLNIYNSGSTVLDIQGSTGQLFSITDSLTGSLFSVNTVAGLPIIEAFSDNTVNIGKFGQYPVKIVNSGTEAVITGSITNAATASYVTPLTQSVNISGNLSVGTNIQFSAQLRDANNNGVITQSPAGVTSNRILTVGNAQYGAITFVRNVQITGSATNSLLIKGSGATSSTTAFRVENSSTSPSMVVLDNGNVGIGTTAPGSALHINTSSPQISLGLFYQYTRIYSALQTDLNTPSSSGHSLVFQTNQTSAGYGFYFRKTNGKGAASITSGIAGTVNLTSGGFTPSGSGNGVYKHLDIAYELDGTAGAQTGTGYGIYLNATETSLNGMTSALMDLRSNGSSRLFVAGSGNVGIGTTNPTTKLDVKGSGTTSSTTAFLVQNANATASLEVLDNGTVIPKYISMTVPNAYSNSNGIYMTNGNGYFNLSIAGDQPRITTSNQVVFNSHLALFSSKHLYLGNNSTIRTYNQIPLFQYTEIDWQGGIRSGAVTLGQSLGNVLGTSTLLGFNKKYINSFAVNFETKYTGSANYSGFVGSYFGQTLTANTDNNVLIGSLIIPTFNENSTVGTTKIALGIQSNEGYAIYQSGSSTVNYFAGDVGIGTTNPTTKLDVRGNVSISGSFSGASGYPIEATNTEASNPQFLNFKAPGNGSNDGMTIGQYTAVTGRPFVIQTTQADGWGNLTLQRYGGSVGIGTISPSAKLHVKGSGTTNATTAFRVENANASGSMVVLDNGFVGIGTTSPAYTLEVNGSIQGDTVGATSGMSISNYLAFYVANVQFINKSQTTFIPLLTRNTTGAEAVYDMSNIGSITASGSTGIGISGSSAKLAVYKSGSTVLDVQGSQGQLFSVVDSLTGSLMSVNDVSGLPILEVFSDDRVEMGTYGNPAIVVSGSSVKTGNIEITGSLIGQPIDITPVTATASLDCSLGNFFDLTLSSSYELYLSASNIQAGQTMNLRITQPATSGSLTYGSEFKFPGGIPYEVSATGSAVDIVSFISFDSSTLYGTAIKNLS